MELSEESDRKHGGGLYMDDCHGRKKPAYKQCKPKSHNLEFDSKLISPVDVITLMTTSRWLRR